MKKGDIVELTIDNLKYPGNAWGTVDNCLIHVKSAIPGQRLEIVVKKRRKKYEGRVLSVLKKAPGEIAPACLVFGKCGGCSLQNISYDKQLACKETGVLSLLAQAGITGFKYEGIMPSPQLYSYRNKMELSFGNDMKDGPLQLGFHQRDSHFNIVDGTGCTIAHPDFGRIAAAVRDFYKARGTAHYRNRSHEGLLRHLVLRRGAATGQLLINLVTTSQGDAEPSALVYELLRLPLDGQIRGILHTVNNRVADIVAVDEMCLLYGKPLIEDKILGLSFEISPFSFFQTNTFGAEKLYATVRDYVCDNQAHQNGLVYDLYCGTGTIAQVLAPYVERVIGVELVKEALDAAKKNVRKNGLSQCEFIAGDVLEVMEHLNCHPDTIILDPPRDGIHPKAIFKILDFRPRTFVYVSCKPSSLVRDLPFFIHAGYTVDKVRCVDLFPQTWHVETVVLMSRV